MRGRVTIFLVGQLHQTPQLQHGMTEVRTPTTLQTLSMLCGNVQLTQITIVIETQVT